MRADPFGCGAVAMGQAEEERLIRRDSPYVILDEGLGRRERDGRDDAQARSAV